MFLGLINTSESTLLAILIPLIIFVTILIILFVLLLCTCAIKRTCVAKNTLGEDHNQQPTYEEIIQYHKELSMEENAAYVHITCAN